MAFLRSRRGLSLVGFAVVVAVACVALGLWQLERYEQRQARNASVEAALAAATVPIGDLVPVGATVEDVGEDVQWRSVSLQGRYDESGQITLRLRPVDGQSGVHVLTPLVRPDGTAVLVDRGFLPTRTAGEAAPVPPPADGTVQVEGRLRLSETGRGSGLDADSQPPSVRFVDTDELAGTLDLSLAPVWVEQVSQTPPADAALLPVPPPRLSAGTSLIYAVQWFLFGVIAIVGFVVLARREERPERRDARPGQRPDAHPDQRSRQPA